MKSGSLVRVVWAFSVLLPAAISAAPSPARACGTEVFSHVDESAARISRAEKALSTGKATQAAVGVVQTFPAIMKTKVGASPLSDRALRIMALAAVRSEGALSVGKAMQGTTAEDKEKNLLFAIDTLRALDKRRVNNPSFQTDLAEALAKVPRFKAEALQILEKLAKSDLVASAEGYRTLAELRANTGDATGRDGAVKRCEGMTKTPALCVVKDGDTASRS
jgi:hypothetical protein